MTFLMLKSVSYEILYDLWNGTLRLKMFLPYYETAI